MKNDEGRQPGRERDRNADLIRCVAVYSVLSVHFLLNTGFYSVPTVGWEMLLMCVYRAFFMACVPLFLILTGYLMQAKKLSGSYYRGIIKTLEIYVLASVACLLFKKFVLGYQVTVKTAVLDILDFDAANYAWYIEMYIGLFLMIPFLNLAYHGLKSRREKLALVLTMAALTFLPKLLNMFDFRTPGWWSSPSLSKTYDPIVPGFFTAMYPITYYYIGAYLREFGWKPGRWKNAALLALAVALFGWYNFYRSDGGAFVWGNNSTWGGENLITAVLLFTLLLNLNVKRWPRTVHTVLYRISNLSLGLYLVSWIADRLVYDGWLNQAVTEPAARWKFFPVVVPAVFLLSAAGASVLYLVRFALHRMAGLLRRKSAAV